MTSSTVSSENVARPERGDLCGIDHHPAAVSSERVERQEQGDLCSSEISEQLLTEPTKNPKPNNNEDPDQERGDPKYRNGCKNSKRILWMTEFLNTETHTQVLLMDYLSSVRLREVWIWVNTVFILTSLKTEIARSVKGPKLQGPHAEDAMAEPYLVLRILVI